MSYNQAKTVTGTPDPIPVKCRIAGQTEVVDSLIKRVVLFDRRNMELLAARNVSPDNTWELFSQDRGDGNHLLIGLDEGGNFNISGFDRASLGIHTYPVDTEGYEQAQPDKQAFYVAETNSFNFDDLTPVKLKGDLEVYTPVSGLYFIENYFGAFGHFENGEGVLIQVGAGTDYPNFVVGTSFKIGGQFFTIERLSDNGEMVFLHRPVGVSKGDIFDNDSCIFNLPSVLSLVTTTGHTVNAGIAQYQSNAGCFTAGDTRLTDFYPDASMKTLSFNFQTDVSNGQRMFLISIPGFLEIAVAESYDYVQVATGNGVITNSVQIDLNTQIYFVCFCFSESNTTVYVDNMTTVKATLPAVTFTGQSPLVINAQAGYGTYTPANYKIFLGCIRAFSATLDATARTTLMGASLNKTPERLLVESVSTLYSDENVKSVAKKDVATFNPYSSGISFFKNSPPVGFKVDLAATLKKSNPSIFDALNVGPRVIRVPQDYSTITLAVTNAVNGDIILIAPGTYSEQVTITDKVVHLIGNTDDPVTNPIRMTASYRALMPNYATEIQSAVYEYFEKAPMVIQNITFVQANTLYECVYLTLRNYNMRLRFDFVNCSFTNTGKLFTFLYDTACIMRFFNCNLTRGASYNTFYNFKFDLLNTGGVEFHKCRLYNELSINGTGTLAYNDSVLVDTAGYGFSYPANYSLLADKKIEPIYFSISPDILSEAQTDVKIGIDLSLHPEIFDEVTDTSDLSVIFQDGSFLDIEVETYDVANKKGLLWVSLPTVSSSEITYFALIYKNSDSAVGGPESEEAHNVWADYDVVYHMTDDPVGTGAVTNSAADSYHGTPSGMAIGDRSYAPLSGYEYSFDGTKKITIADLYQSKAMEGTIEVVFKSTQTDGHILSQDADGWNDRDVNLSIGDPTGVVSTVSDGYLNFEAYGPETSEVKNITSTVAVNDGQYHYAGVTWYRDNFGLVLDDAIDVAALDYKMWPGTGNVMIGTDGTNFFNGSIGEVLISKSFNNLGAHELLNRSIQGNIFSFGETNEIIGVINPAILLHLDNNITDSSGNNVLVSTDTTPIYVDGKFNKCLDFNSNNCLNIPNSSNFSVGTGDFTWSFWIKPNTVINDKFLIDGRFSVGSGLHVTTGGYGGSTIGVVRYVCSNSILGSTVLQADTWYHIALVRNSGTVSIYVDGKLDGSGTDTGNYSTNTGTWHIGKNSYGGGYPPCAIDDIVFVDYALYTDDFDVPTGKYVIGESVPSYITATCTSSKKAHNVPLKIDLKNTGLDSNVIDPLINTPDNIIALSSNGTPLKIEKLDWSGGVTAFIWVLFDTINEGDTLIRLRKSESASADIGVIGSDAGKAVWGGYDAVYHLCQDPSVAIMDSTGNHTNATPVNMDASNLVNGVTVFNGTDESINLGALFDGVQDASQIHMSVKTSQASSPLLMQGTSGVKLTATGIVKADTTNTLEGVTVVNDNTWHTITVAHDLHKRDLFIDGVDEIPYGIFGSDGNSDVILAGNYLGASFVGNIPEFRIKSDADYQEKLILNGKLWKETLVDIPNDPQMIPVFSFDGGSTYCVWTGAWMAIASTDDTIHGDTGDGDWHYISGEDIWFKSTINTLNDALMTAAEYIENRNHVDVIYGLTSEEWTSTGGMSADGTFQCAFVFNSCIEGLCSAIENVTIDGNMVYGFGAIDLDAFHEVITESNIGWSISITDATYDYSQVQVYSCITGGTWQVCTRGGAIPGITEGMATTGLKLYFKAVAPVGLPENSKMVLTPRII